MQCAADLSELNRRPCAKARPLACCLAPWSAGDAYSTTSEVSSELVYALRNCTQTPIGSVRTLLLFGLACSSESDIYPVISDKLSLRSHLLQ